MSLLNNVKITRVLAAVSDGQAASATDILDMSGFEGVMFIAKVADVTSGSVLTLQVQQDALNGAGSMANLTGAVATYTAGATDADDDLLVVDVYKPEKQYVRAVLTSATQNAVKDGVIAIQYGPVRKVPITQGSTVLASAFVASPAE